MRWFVVLTVAALMACAAREAQESALESNGEVPAMTNVEVRGLEVTRVVSSGREVIAHEVPVEANAVWAAMPSAFDEVGFSGAGVIDADRRVFGFPNAVIPRRLGANRLSAYMDCGRSPGGANADTYRVTGSVLAAVRPGTEGKSIVEVAVEATARPREVSGNAMRCSSNGRLERLIAYTAALHAMTGP